MRVNIVKFILTVTTVVVLAGCSNQSPRLLNVGASNVSPDEFAVLPGKPLQAPASFSDLPEPTTGSSNITDPTPQANAVMALGGNPNVLTRAGIPVTDGALLAHTQRFGMSTNIRGQLSDADLAFRRRHGALFFMRWFTKNRYYAAYRSQSLDQYRELERLRSAGVKTPSAPPKPTR